MAKYLVLWKANPAAWPTDPKQSLATIEQATAGGEELMKAGAVVEMGWLTAQDCFAIFDADSKDSVLGCYSSSFPTSPRKSTKSCLGRMAGKLFLAAPARPPPADPNVGASRRPRGMGAPSPSRPGLRRRRDTTAKRVG